MPNKENEDIIEVKEERLLKFLKNLCQTVKTVDPNKKNTICVMPSDFKTGFKDWAKVCFDEMDTLATDPYWIIYQKDLSWVRTESEKLIRDRSPIAERLLDTIMKNHPIMLNRAPSLHKFSILSFMSKRTPGTAIKIPPLVVQGFNADHDGDAMMVHVPVSDQAVREAHKMLPSNNLYNPGTGGLMMYPQEASALGLYKMSQTSDGRIEINKSIRKFIPDYPTVTKEMTKQNALTILVDIGKRFPGVYTKIIDELKTKGDDYAYSTGFTVGLSDLDVDTKRRDQILAEADKRAAPIKRKAVLDRQDLQRFEKIYLDADKILRKDLDKQLADRNNEFRSMVVAGAKGKMDNTIEVLPLDKYPYFLKDYMKIKDSLEVEL